MAIVTPVLRDPKLFKYKGFCFFNKIMQTDHIDSLQDFKIRDDDVFLITFPKSGTSWMQQILSLICIEQHRNGTEQIDTTDRVPWFELLVKKEHVQDYDSQPSPRIFVSHLSYLFVPQGLRCKKAKIIYVMRNPKDAMKSLYHFEDKTVYGEKTPGFDHFFEKFLAGDVFAGSWFDHVRGWYTHKDDFKILFVKYEDMIKDLLSVVKQICVFLEKELDDESLNVVVNRATFNNMKMDPLANKENQHDKFSNLGKFGAFLRKGTIGDWKNIFTVAQSEAFDKLYQEKMADLPINFTWDIADENKKKTI